MPALLLPVEHFEQRRDGECLAACAAMVLAYMNFPFTYERLVALLRIQEGVGTGAFNVHELERLGLTVIYKRGTLDELREHLTNNRPCIAFVNTGELPYWNEATGHAVVVIGLDNQYVHVNDPAFPNAPIQASHGDFGLAWLERDEYYAALSRRT